ncbi:MAG: hypothetical protein JWM28_4532 [Chitinophagaceae bacterium]|nr:hypothetical protein [Chitinophagaceae bacterium]
MRRIGITSAARQQQVNDDPAARKIEQSVNEYTVAKHICNERTGKAIPILKK